MLNKFSRFFLLIIFFGGLSISFNTSNEAYIFPIDTYRALSGTFGELRNNHFHSGIDIKTGGRSGAPLKAVQDGFVYRIKVSPYGFGNAIYLRHADGRFSVYAHMSRFNERIADYVYKRQKAARQFAREIYLGKSEMPVKQGDIIGYSGNSGSSSGPHLHFELRDPQERIMNPLIWFEDEIRDTQKPVVQEIAFEPLNAKARVRGEFRKLRLTPALVGNDYRINSIISIYGDIGIEYRAFDLLNEARNHCGINYVKLWLDEQLVHEFDLKTFAFDETRYINVHMDYDHYKSARQRFQKAYVDRGNDFSAYKGNRRGIISLQDDEVHEFRLELTDAHNNQRNITGRLQRKIPIDPFPSRPTYYQTPRVEYKIHRNVLVLTAQRAHKSYIDGLYYTNQYGEEKTLPPAYMVNSRMIFLLPLDRYDYPKTIFDKIEQFKLDLNLKEEIRPHKNNLVQFDELQLFFPYESVFDHVHLQVSKKAGKTDMYSDIYKVGNPHIPLFKSYLVSFKPKRNVPLEQLVVAYLDNNDGWKFLGSKLGEDGNVYASTREFGNFCLMIDEEPPIIEALNFYDGKTIPSNQSNLRLRIDDTFSGIEHTEIFGSLNGTWILFEYDYKRNTITHTFPEGRPDKGEYELKIRVVDGARNQSQKVYKLIF